jgi:hypothetical protein
MFASGALVARGSMWFGARLFQAARPGFPPGVLIPPFRAPDSRRIGIRHLQLPGNPAGPSQQGYGTDPTVGVLKGR